MTFLIFFLDKIFFPAQNQKFREIRSHNVQKLQEIIDKVAVSSALHTTADWVRIISIRVIDWTAVMINSLLAHSRELMIDGCTHHHSPCPAPPVSNLTATPRGCWLRPTTTEHLQYFQTSS